MIYLNRCITLIKMINFTDINLNEITELCLIMNKYGSDKGNGWHNYTKIYHHLFKNKKNDLLNVFELGLGTNNLDIPSNMGKDGKPGASLYGWREYFPNSKIYGADIDTRILFNSEKIKTYYTNQLDKNAIQNMWNNIEEKFDIIIDDGLHTFEANVIFLENSFEYLKDNGIYIIEDIHKEDINKFNKYLDNNNYKKYQILDIPNNNNPYDNVLIIITK